MLKRLFNVTGIQSQSLEQRQAELYRNLMRREAKIGGELFGPAPRGGRREFFCLDKYTWVWHEEWLDKNGKKHTRTTRYNVRPDVILKSVDGKQYQQTNDNEVSRLLDAVDAYLNRVRKELYHSVA